MATNLYKEHLKGVKLGTQVRIAFVKAKNAIGEWEVDDAFASMFTPPIRRRGRGKKRNLKTTEVKNKLSKNSKISSAPKGTLFPGGMNGRTEKQVLAAKPSTWKKVKADGNGWKLLDENGVERVRYMRPNPKGRFTHEKTGYWRLQNSSGDYLEGIWEVIQCGRGGVRFCVVFLLGA